LLIQSIFKSRVLLRRTHAIETPRNLCWFSLFVNMSFGTGLWLQDLPEGLSGAVIHG
jgi:hypothetical protein